MDFFKYLGMVCNRHTNLKTVADAAPRPFNASTSRIKELIREHGLTNRLHVYMWLLKIYTFFPGMYASLVVTTQVVINQKDISDNQI